MTRKTDEQLDERYTTQGYAAYWAGRQPEDNPHAAGFLNAECWHNGWVNAAHYDREQKEAVAASVAKMRAEMEAARERRTAKQKRGAANKAARAEANRASQRAKSK